MASAGGSLPRPDHHLTDGALARYLWPQSEGWAAKKYLDAAGTPALTDSNAALRDDAWLESHVVDVGQGDGIWVHTFDDNIPGNGRYEGKNVVIDGGPRSSDATDRRYQDLKDKAHEGAVIDALIVTHPHTDHSPGALAVLRHFESGEYYDPGFPSLSTRTRTFVTRWTRRAPRGGRSSNMWGGEASALQIGETSSRSNGCGPGPGRPRVWEVTTTWSTTHRSSFAWSTAPRACSSWGTPRGGPKRERRLGRVCRGSTPRGPRTRGAQVDGAQGRAPLEQDLEHRALHRGGGSQGRDRLLGAALVPWHLFLPDRETLEHICGHNSATRIYRPDQDDEVEHSDGTNDADGDDIVIRTNGKATLVVASSGGTPFIATGGAA